MLLIISIILIIISIVLIILSISKAKHTHTINKDIDIKNKELTDEYNKLLNKNNIIQSEIDNKENILNIKEKELENIQNNISKTFDNQKELSQKAFDNYCDILEKQYEQQEEEYNECINILKSSYADLQSKLLQESNEVQVDLDKIKATRTAAIQAITKEKEIEKNKDDFRLNISELAQKDIRLLKSIQPEITNAIVIDKIIWSNYYQPLAKVKFPKIIGKATTCGIYKITSLETGLCYIGQSLDCCDRWKQHCKNALGVGNNNAKSKLYLAMRENGLYNFTFEILEECEAKYLDEKEKYYIDLYDAYNFGLNGNKGNG